MQSFPDLDKKLAERHRVIFGTVETVRGETVRAVQFPDIGLMIAGEAMRTVTLEQAMKFADQFAPPKRVFDPEESTATCPCPQCTKFRSEHPEFFGQMRR